MLAGLLRDASGGLAKISIWEAIIFYWIAWILAIPITKVVLLPLLSFTYLESAGEIRRTRVVDPRGERTAARPGLERRGQARPGTGRPRGVGSPRQAAAAAAEPVRRPPAAGAAGTGVIRRSVSLTSS